MTTPEPQPRDIALEQETPEQAADKDIERRTISAPPARETVSTR